jgi:hypothetical protein
MGVDTEIIINAKWGSDNICEFLNSHFKMDSPAKEEATYTPAYTVILFTLEGGEKRQMNYHREYPTPIGNAVLLTLGCWGRSKEIMTAIGNALGGFYQPEDTKSEYEMIQGMLHIHNGIQYFLDNAVLNGGLTDCNDMAGLKKYIDKWEKKHKR